MARARAAVATAALAAFAGAFVLLAGVGGGAARAHVERYPKRDALVVGPAGTRVTVDYGVPRGDVAAALRAIFDRDKDGALDDDERAALGKHLQREATAFLHVIVDGRDLPLAVRTALVDASGGASDRVSLHLELVGARPLGEGDHRLRVSDRHKDRRVTVPVLVTLEGGLAFRVRPAVLVTVDEGHPATFDLRRAAP